MSKLTKSTSASEAAMILHEIFKKPQVEHFIIVDTGEEIHTFAGIPEEGSPDLHLLRELWITLSEQENTDMFVSLLRVLNKYSTETDCTDCKEKKDCPGPLAKFDQMLEEITIPDNKPKMH